MWTHWLSYPRDSLAAPALPGRVAPGLLGRVTPGLLCYVAPGFPRWIPLTQCNIKSINVIDDDIKREPWNLVPKVKFFSIVFKLCCARIPSLDPPDSHSNWADIPMNHQEMRKGTPSWFINLGSLPMMTHLALRLVRSATFMRGVFVLCLTY